MRRIGARAIVWLPAFAATVCVALAAPSRSLVQDAPKDPAKAQADAKQKFIEQMNKGRYALTLNEATGKTSGAAMQVLNDATADAQFVLVGEDHGIAEIPPFVGTVFEMLAPRGFHTLAIETGPYVTPVLQENAAKADGAAQMSAWLKKYPFAVAFYNWRQEFALLQRCARAGSDGKVELWGLDQELMGASTFLLHRISEQMLGADARAMAAKLTKENEDDYAAAEKTGDPSGLFMMKVKDADLSIFAEQLKAQGNPAAEKILSSLWESRRIYEKNMSGKGFASNRDRSLLMKENFKGDYEAATRTEPLPKVMFKFGGIHMYRGYNLLRNNDIGNMVAELADWNGTKSVHILIFGVKGEEAAFAGIGKPSSAETLDLRTDKRADFAFIEPMLDNMLKDSWTMYDLRGLRPHLGEYGAIDTQLERLILGYDFLVLIPQVTASRDLE